MNTDIISTGYPAMDALLGGGLVPGESITLCGTPRTGKTSMLVNLVYGIPYANVPKNTEKPYLDNIPAVMLAFAESRPEYIRQLLGDIHGRRTGLKPTPNLDPVVNEFKIESLHRRADDAVVLSPWLIYAQEKTVVDDLISAVTEHLEDGVNLRVLVVDDIETMGEGKRDQDLERLGVFCKERNIALVVTVNTYQSLAPVQLLPHKPFHGNRTYILGRPAPGELTIMNVNSRQQCVLAINGPAVTPIETETTTPA